MTWSWLAGLPSSRYFEGLPLWRASASREAPPRLDPAPNSLMPKRSPLLPFDDAPLAKGLVIGWGLFLVFAAVGVVIGLRLSASVPILLDVMPR